MTKQKKYSRSRQSTNKKKFLLGVVGLIFLSILINYVLFFTNQNRFVKGPDDEIIDYLDLLTVDRFKEKNSNNENFIVYIGRDTCTDCSEFEPLLIESLKKREVSSSLYYLNIKEIHKNKDQWEKFKKDYSIKYTPTFAEFNHGKMIDKVEWTPENGISIEKVNNWFLTKQIY